MLEIKGKYNYLKIEINDYIKKIRRTQKQMKMIAGADYTYI